MQPLRHCTAALLTVTIAAVAQAQTPAPATPPTGEASFSIFVRGTEAGRIRVNLARAGANWIITSTGQFGDLVVNRFELKYTTDWQPTELRVEATQGRRRRQLSTSFGVTTAINEITENGVTNAKTDQVSARTVVLPNNFFGAYEGLAARLSTLQAGAELPVYVAPNGEITLTVKNIRPEQRQTPNGLMELRRFALTVQNDGGTLDAVVTIDASGRFATFELPMAALSVVRSDLSGVSVRTVAARNPTDSDVRIAGTAGFSVAGTLTVPPGVGRLRHPTVVLVGGPNSQDRDEVVDGVPIFSQLAGTLAERGFLVLRYDRRGAGQTGGRTESVTLQDYAADVVDVVKWLDRRDDVDKRRIAVVGHGEGAAIGMLAAAREKKISSLVLMAATSTNGAELVLEQQRRQLDLMKLPEAERLERIDLQKKIQDAVTTGKGWENVPPELRRQADTPLFRSQLLFDPSRVISRIKQPILILQGDVDATVPPEHAERLAELARARKNAGPVDVVHFPGVNHLLVRAQTGEAQESANLSEISVSKEVPAALADWLKKQQ